MKKMLGDGWRRYRGWPAWAQVVVALVVLGAVAAPFSSDERTAATVQASDGAKTTTTTAPDTTTSAPEPTLTSGAPSTTTTSAAAGTTTTDQPAPITTSTAPVATSTTVQELVLSGFGSTRAQWDATHTKAKGYTDGSAYLPLVNGKQPTYAGVFGHDRILSYDVYMAPGTSLADAQARVRTELPADARPGKLVSGNGCQIQEFRSVALEHALDGMTVVVAYSDDDPTIPFPQRYRVATLIVTTPGDDQFC